ncbi:MAG TPA: DNA mismatch endonuclease Vsr [Lysobacter sp.]
MDIIGPEQRSALMSRIKGKDTKIELEVRQGLHAVGLRYRLGGAGLPGRPDIVLPKHRTVVFVHGCFWHRHECHLFRLPKTRTEFWKDKIDRNHARDLRRSAELVASGWHVETVWECQLRGRPAEERVEVISELAVRIQSRSRNGKRMTTVPLLKSDSLKTTTADMPTWAVIEDLASKSEVLFIKKLARNDSSWADDPGKHQAGFYIPRQIREAGYFPALSADNPEKPHIYRTSCQALWPQTGEVTASNMSHYSNKGPETHFTVVPHQLFRGLSPASLLLSGRLSRPVADSQYWFVVLDSTSEEAELLETALDLGSTFHSGLFKPGDMRRAASIEHDELAELIDRLQHALRTGTVSDVLSDYAELPSPEAIATAAREEWLKENGKASLDPYSIDAPGDAIMQISRDVEYRIFRRHELRRRATEVLRILTAQTDLVSSVVRGFPDLDAIFLSASQQRKTRAGRSFEHHIAATLTAGRIRYQEQAVTGGRRPDFVLPDATTLRKGSARDFNDALVLAAKTTLRERWKQVSSEGLHCAVYLATVDDRVPDTSIKEMSQQGIRLVVPESLKSSKETWYPKNDSVISFRDFFQNEIRRDRPVLLLPSL